MEANAATTHPSYGLGPRGAPGPHQPSAGPPGPPGASRPDEQQHHKPFFYVQHSQPYLPVQSMQWPVPMPMPYNPYYGYPGLGYGMPMMPNYQPNPYMEPPGFVVPHTHLHLMDYRRVLNPQYYQTMAYHSRRFRYQHNSQTTREMISSEVQTEPLSATQRTSTPGPGSAEAPVGLPDCNGRPGVPGGQPVSPGFAAPRGDRAPEAKDVAPPASAARVSPNGSFVIQTEEVRIECCATPTGLQLLHSHETAEVSHSFSGDVVQRSSVLQGRVLQDQGPAPDRALQQARPDILLVGAPDGSEGIPTLEEAPGTQMDPAAVASSVGSQADVQEDQSPTSKHLPCRTAHLPVDPAGLDEPEKMESTVWLMEEILIPTPDSLIQNDHTEFYDETPATVAEEPAADEAPVDEMPSDEVVTMIEVPSPTSDRLEAPGDEMVSETHVPVAEETPVAADRTPYSPLLGNSSPDANGNQRGGETNADDHQDTSFESLPAYLPSTRWLEDFDSVYYGGEFPATPKKPARPLGSPGLDVPSRRRKLDLEHNEQSGARQPKERYEPKGGGGDRRSASDHECCLGRGEDAFSPYAAKRDRLCPGCLVRCRTYATASPAPKRKATPFQPRNGTLYPTCETCKSHSAKQARKGSGADVRGPRCGRDTEGESSENGSCRAAARRASVGRPGKARDPKRPLASKQNSAPGPAASRPGPREKDCVCGEPRRHSVAWERLRHCPHGNTIRARDENSAVPVALQDKWRSADQIYLTHRWHTAERSWEAVIPKPDGDGFRRDARSQLLNKHKKSQPQSQSQVTRRKHTRC